jgi:trans-aconitate 2-methyltransferase
MENTSNHGNQQAIKSFYNSFKKKQVITGVNLRHYMVFEKCIRAGLKKDHQILEIGCGIGTFTRLMASYIKKGSIIAADISNESIEEAKRRIKPSQKVKFIVSDMSDFQSDIKFDFVVMVDVLEHIPFESYDKLFGMIGSCTHENSILAMNIPHPDMIRFIRKNHPEMLQIIDNSVEMDHLSSHIYKNGFRLSSYNPYCIHNEDNDYVFMTFEKEGRTKTFGLIPKLKIQKRKFYYRLKYNLLRLISS